MVTAFGVGLVAFSMVAAVYSALQKMASAAFDQQFNFLLVVFLLWAMGAAAVFLLGAPLRQKVNLRIAAMAVATILAILAGLEQISSAPYRILTFIDFALYGILVSSLVVSPLENGLMRTALPSIGAAMRARYNAFLVGAGLGAVVFSGVFSFGNSQVVSNLAALTMTFALLTQVESKASKVLASVFSLAIAVMTFFFAMGEQAIETRATRKIATSIEGIDYGMQLDLRKMNDVLLIGIQLPEPILEITRNSPAQVVVVESPADSVKLIRQKLNADELKRVEFVESDLRHFLARTSRRFDLIQTSLAPQSEPFNLLAPQLRVVTLESAMKMLVHLKEAGAMQFVAPQDGFALRQSNSVISTVHEAWKRVGRKDFDLYSLALASQANFPFLNFFISTQPISKEARDHAFSQYSTQRPNLTWVFPSDISGEIVFDEHPFSLESDRLGSDSKTVFYMTLFAILLMFAWIAVLERRKGFASRWQILSIAVYFAGLGSAFAAFITFFAVRAARTWGLGDSVLGLVVGVSLLAMAMGAIWSLGRAKKRFGVRIQPLAYFVFAALFTYLGGTFVEAYLIKAETWLAYSVGLTLLVPFGIYGGAFIPNALEEAAEKLQPKSVYLFWSCFALGASLGLFLAMDAGLSSGQNMMFVVGLLLFSWVAIIGGIVRPFSVRVTG